MDTIEIKTMNELKLNVSKMKELCSVLDIKFSNYRMPLDIRLGSDLVESMYKSNQDNQWLKSHYCSVSNRGIIINYDDDDDFIEFLPIYSINQALLSPNTNNITIIPNSEIFIYSSEEETNINNNNSENGDFSVCHKNNNK